MLNAHILKGMVIKSIQNNGDLDFRTTIQLSIATSNILDELKDKLMDSMDEMFKDVSEFRKEKRFECAEDVLKRVNTLNLALLRVEEIRWTIHSMENK